MKGEYDTPGKYYRINTVTVGVKPYGYAVAVFPSSTDEAEREEFIGLLNKGTRFEQMLAALKAIQRECDNPNMSDRDALGCIAVCAHKAITAAEPPK